MSDKKEITVQVGPGFMGSLTLIFIVLKLTDVIDWSWWWVLSPLWLPVVIFFLGAALILGLVAMVGRK